MKQKLDINSWARKEHFNFFNTFEEPYYGVCVNIDCTAAYKFAKENKVSFFLYYLYQALAAAQLNEPFKYRIEGEEVFIYDRIDAGSTVNRDNGTFGFMDLQYYPTFEEFIIPATKKVEYMRFTTNLERSPAINVIRFSALPWIDFTSISHARSFYFKDSAPKISFGKMTEINGRKSMPVSIHVHHALVDGADVARYIDSYRELMNRS